MTPQNAQIAAFVSKKALEISYALFRVGDACGNPAFQSALHSNAIDLFDAANHYDAESLNAAIAAIAAIRQFLQFGSIAGLIAEKDIQLLSDELDNLNAAIKAAISECGNRQLPDSVLQDSFPSGTMPSVARNHQKKSAPAKDKELNKNESAPQIIVDEDLEEEEPEKLLRGEAAPARQAKVIERIRQMGDCHLRDVQDYLPGVSERTLRYDLQELIAQGKVERVGAGPSMYYRLKPALLGTPVSVA